MLSGSAHAIGPRLTPAQLHQCVVDHILGRVPDNGTIEPEVIFDPTQLRGTRSTTGRAVVSSTAWAARIADKIFVRPFANQHVIHQIALPTNLRSRHLEAVLEAISPDGEWVFVRFWASRTGVLYRVSDGMEIYEPFREIADSGAVQFSNDSRMALVRHVDRNGELVRLSVLDLLSAHPGVPTRTWETHGDGENYAIVSAMQFFISSMPRPSRFAPLVHRWADFATGHSAPLAHFPEFNGQFNRSGRAENWYAGVTISPSGRYALAHVINGTAGADDIGLVETHASRVDVVSLFPVSQGSVDEPVRSYELPGESFSRMAMSPDDRLVAVSRAGAIRIFGGRSSGAASQPFMINIGNVEPTSLVFVDRHSIVTGDALGRVLRWSLPSNL